MIPATDTDTPLDRPPLAPESLRTRSDLKGLLLVSLMIVTCALLLSLHLHLHTGHGITDVLRDPAAYLDRFDYVGGRENGYTVGIEITIWSLMGIHCRLAYIIGNASLGTGVDLSQMFTLWFSTALFGWGTTSVLLALLRCVSIDIGDTSLGLHRVDAVMTVAFFCGFYNEQTRRILANLRSLALRDPASGP